MSTDALRVDQVENAYGEAVATGKHGDDFLAALTESLNSARTATPPANALRVSYAASFRAGMLMLQQIRGRMTKVTVEDVALLIASINEQYATPPASAERDARPTTQAGRDFGRWLSVRLADDEIVSALAAILATEDEAARYADKLAMAEAASAERRSWTGTILNGEPPASAEPHHWQGRDAIRDNCDECGQLLTAPIHNRAAELYPDSLALENEDGSFRPATASAEHSLGDGHGHFPGTQNDPYRPDGMVTPPASAERSPATRHTRGGHPKGGRRQRAADA